MATTRGRRRRALAAGGIVLGIGAAAVAASWTDRVLGSTEFSSGGFGIESSTNGGSTWASHPIGAANPLVFTTSATGLIPGSVVYAPLRLRTEAGSAAASVRLQPAVLAGTGAGNLSVELRYRVVRGSATCDTAAFGAAATFVVGSSSTAEPLNVAAAASFPLAAGATAATPGTAVPLCFEIGLPATNANWTNSTLQNKTLIANWPFDGTS